ncbi:dTDP-4-dehydrorhamnose reductase [Microvirga flavescens]|uniref:dTDP-4-dehydrorhamnose reductase n=1 Tax=Microvirga flavescens TaxID=2249811 RepID=UPI000DDBDB67|nr:dTDP-4-dehydrorhamnose reductase [Microvirga flavescens]
MRILVTGTEGQVARAMRERGAFHGVDVIPVGRPTIDLASPSGLEDTLMELGGDVIVNAAAYTAVDQAETEAELAQAINGIGAGALAGAAAAMNIPVIQISTDYVFDGTKDAPYREDDPVSPLGAYGLSKLMGEEAVAEETPNHVILRTAWVYSPFGKNFVKTMLRLAEGRDEVAVVGDQRGAPTNALDIADGIIAVARNLTAYPKEREMRGIFHMTGTGTASWAQFAAAIFECSAAFGGPTARVRPITTTEYPTPAKRPANSVLDCTKIGSIHGVTLPSWRMSLEPCVKRILEEARERAS